MLNNISNTSDLHNLSDAELDALAKEIREEILATTSVTGGHVASSLGAVELTLAIHSEIFSPNDKLLFDVGHQAYAHKLLTGRRDKFYTLRQHGGISGFPKPSESPHDVYASGHASDSLSIALGLAKARDLRGGREKIVTVIGDASIAGGMAFEALNHIGQAQCPMTIILNDNEMSIGKNVGALMRHLGMMRASSEYGRAKDALQDRMDNSGAFMRSMLSFGKNWKESVKQFILPHSMIYENLGIVCTVPIDGHNIGLLREVIGGVLGADVPVLVHVVTKKGAGFEPAMKDPVRFHGTGPFDVETGEAAGACASAGDFAGACKTSAKSVEKKLTFTDVMGAALCEEAKKDSRIVTITAAMAKGTGLLPFRDKFPERFVDTGIAEGHAVGLAAGLAAGGNKPVVCLYSTFFQRAVDQTVINVALQNLPVVFCIDRAGLVGADGPTHHGVFDIAFLRAIPNMHIIAPSCAADLKLALKTALNMNAPVAIRYPKGVAASDFAEAGRTRDFAEAMQGCEEGCRMQDAQDCEDVGCSENTLDYKVADSSGGTLEIGRARTLKEGSDVAILAFGGMVVTALQVSEKLAESNKSVRVVDMRWVKPLDAHAIRKAAKLPLVVTLEDGAIAGGVGEAVLEVLSCPTEPATECANTPANTAPSTECANAASCAAPHPKTLTLGIPDAFIGQGTIDQLHKDIGLDAASIASKICNVLKL